MTSPVEASSLSGLAFIASNPPLDPAAPVPPPALPLVLYIARVPGSRDVFLTPIKPREKVVTAEDVQSSLYYVHVHCEDVNPAASHLLSDAGDLMSTTVPPPLPARRPPPPWPAHNNTSAVDPVTGPTSRSHRIARKPVLADVTNRSNHISSPSQVGLPELPRRPLPTLPDEQNISISSHAENVRLLRHSEHDDAANPYSRKYEPTLPVTAVDPPPGTLTLIRRDTGSSEQWNVASVHDPPVQQVSSATLLNSSAARRTKKGGEPLYLDITNPGYASFIDSNPSNSRTSINSIDSADGPPEGIFRRRLYMPGSRYGEHYYGSRKSSSIDSSSSANKRGSMRGSTNPAFSAANSAPSSLDRRTKGYTFTSPWDGHCEFLTGATGKSLKCRHTVGQSSAVDVSELRFNLPSSAKVQHTVSSQKRSSYFSHQRHQSINEWEGESSASSIVIGEDGHIDRSLGQENAGGGFGGKQAKLGKLIIEPEGLKMLDLLVAANVGLWWRAYERL